MTDDQIEKLIKIITDHFRKEWSDEFNDEDAVRISDFCNDEVDIPFPFLRGDIEWVIAEYERKY